MSNITETSKAAEGTLALSWGAYGGFYLLRKPICWRLCLGRLAFTWVAIELDELMEAYAAAGQAAPAKGDSDG